MFDLDQTFGGDMFVRNKIFAAIAALACLLPVVGVHAAQPVDWQIDLQPGATSVMEGIRWFGHYTLWFMIPITIIVLLLLIYVVMRFRAKANPVPSKTSHNTAVEVVWTLGPVVILFFLAIPSFKLLDKELIIPDDVAMTVKATGNQWYWSYEYQGETEVSFDSILLKDGERANLGKEDKVQYPRLLAVDNEVVVPVGKTVRLLVTASDVIHSLAVPAFGIKIDAVPGRLNETWFKAEAEGLYYGQCSELCGKDHAYMPVAVRVVSESKYEAWLAAAADDVESANKALMASIETSGDLKLASNDQ
jgi:cytochrome c oxidase subunit 2